MKWTYAKAGVDLAKHREMHKLVLEKIAEHNARLGVDFGGLGGYASWLHIREPGKLVLHADGVGTKSLVAVELGKPEVIGWDCVAMNVNDVACEAAEPIALLDYIAMPEPDSKVFAKIVEGIISAAEKTRVPILGGETAILPDLAQGVDAVCFIVGFKRRTSIIRASESNIVLGVYSNGLHANGYTLVRKVLIDKLGSYRGVLEGIDLSSELVKPTAIYSDLVLEAYRMSYINAAAHITGGGFTKIARILPPNVDIILNAPEPPEIFKIIMKLGSVDIKEMYRVFNMGIGLVLVTTKENVDKLFSLVEKHGHRAIVLGYTTRGKGRILIKTWRGDKIAFQD